VTARNVGELAAMVVLIVLGVTIGVLLHDCRPSPRTDPLWELDGGARPLMAPGGLP
jgi:hypothetical protein